MRDVETLDAPGRLRQIERFLQALGDHLRAGLKDAEALLEAERGVALGKLQHGALGPALRRVNLKAGAAAQRGGAALGKQRLQRLAVVLRRTDPGSA